MATKSKNRTDIYAKVTNQIVAELERGVRPWHKPWNAEHAAGRICRPLRHNGAPYQGINILMLWASAEDAGFHCPHWLTFKQAKELGGSVRKGEKGSPVVYASTFTRSETTDDGAEVAEQVPFLKQYTVFNACQVDGLPARYYELAAAPRETVERIEQADRFFAATGAEIRTGGNRAYYTIEGDYIQLPPIECFVDSESHAAVLSHEAAHWTRHPSRLDRDLGRKRWGDAGYAMEELVAELGSAFLCADLEITPEVREDHASYLASWLEVLKADKRAIFTAASLASKAVDFLHGLQPTAES
ncbi:DNA primase TraC [Posidoniimonas corsicana]|uniref:DNA primase TraC n=1 Tax=Posidoniimonas corsicana TaxID=1938618 RepID=A0A5C5VA63_9BACT|nr:zincin-like metallopeptidase domain-containing protein [Posidoniimonas corsicana]TWT35191.1 DNA primase TraC [Posidoniimonas corsicana]